jgi:hypothetical protein
MSEQLDQDLKRVIVVATAISFGCMFAALQTLGPNVNPTSFSFKVTGNTGVAFLVGAASVLPFWKIIFDSRQSFSRISMILLCSLVGAGAFLYPLRFIPKEKMPEIFTGLGLAVFALSTIGAFLVKIGQALQNGEPTES